MDWLEIGSIIVVGVLGVWGGWKVWKHIPKEIGEAFMAVASAVEDDDVSRED